MDCIGNQSTQQYDLACSQAPEQALYEPGPAGELNWRHPIEERHGLAHNRLQLHTQLSSPPTSDTGSTANASHEETASHDYVPEDSTSTEAVKRWSRVRYANENYWLTEIGSCLVALGALVAIVCVLRQYDGNLLPDWRYGITLNALVSLWYAKSRPLKDIESFDDASRGPWGSLLLMLDFRSHYVASFGAFLTVIAMAVDPFTQQVVQTQSCLWKDNSTVARIPRTNIYNISDIPGRYPTETTMYPAMAVAIYSGIISPPDNVSSIIKPICPSGNCTFPEYDGKAYQSIAMCHRCDDITDIVQNHTKISNEFLTGAEWNYSLPSGPNVTMGQSFSTTTRNSTLRDEISVFDIEMLMYTNQSGPDVGTWKDKDVEMKVHLLAAHCSLTPCVKTYKAQIARNVLQEYEMSREVIKYRSYQEFAMISDQVVRNGMLHNCSITLNRTAENNVMVNRINSPKFNTSDVWFVWTSEDCYWQFSRAGYLQTQQMLGDLFKGSKLSFTYTPLEPMGDIWLQSLYKGGAASMSSVDQFMGSLADSITRHIRTEGFRAPETWAEGSVLVERTCVHVSWPWLAFPAALLVLVSVFICLTVLATQRTRWREEHGIADGEAAAGVGFIKSNPLALLFFGLHRDVLDETQRPDTTVAMQDIAENVEVALKWCWIDGQWQFVKAKSE